jgi:hypothetical protein
VRGLIVSQSIVRGLICGKVNCEGVNYKKVNL